MQHAERAVSVVRPYYRSKNGRTLGTGTDASFDAYVKEALRGLEKIYPTYIMKRGTFMTDEMRAIRARMNLQDIKAATLWALWVSQSQGVTRGSDRLRKPEECRKSWDKRRPQT